MDHRQAAHDRIQELVALLRADARAAELASLIAECESLCRAITAFHMEGIRFRIYNVDRMLARGGTPAPERAPALVAEARAHLEAAGFHTRSHQAPG